jgi:aldose 1-epimerase
MKDLKTIEIISESGFNVQLLNLGCSITKICAKDRFENRSNVVLNHSRLSEYFTNNSFLGCVIGPISGRSENGIIMINDNVTQLDTSCDRNSLHSCDKGLHNVIWDIVDQSENKVTFTYIQQNIEFFIQYSVEQEKLIMDISAYSNDDTYLSITNHTYFNLSGDYSSSIEDHKLMLNCLEYGYLNKDSIPVKLKKTQNSIFDFSNPKYLKEVLNTNSNEILPYGGIDHPFKCNGTKDILTLIHENSGRILKISTNQPYVVIYTGNHLNKSTIYNKHCGICFETQDLPSVTTRKLDKFEIVSKANPYKKRTEYKFEIK